MAQGRAGDAAAGRPARLAAGRRTGRLGVLVPPANPTVEPEMGTLAGPGVSVHAARLPVSPGSLADRLAAYNEALAATLGGFGGLPLDAVVFACTGSSYLLGPAADRRRCADLTARHGAPVTSSALAVLDCLAALGEAGGATPGVTLLSPYPGWLTDLSRRYWQAAGVPVREVLAVPGSGAIYDLDTAAVAAVLHRADPDRHRTLLLAGTGMPTVAAIDAFAPRWPHPVLSSAVCSAWWGRAALAAAGVALAAPSPCLAALARHHAAVARNGSGEHPGAD